MSTQFRYSVLLYAALAFSSATFAQGFTPTDPVPLNTDATTDGTDTDLFPQLTTDGQGHWVAVWESDDIMLARSTDNGQSWTTPAKLNPNDTVDGVSPQVVTDGLGHWVAVWQTAGSQNGSNVEWDILVARSNDNGATWTYPAALNTNAATDGELDDYSPQVTTDTHGNWIATWSSHYGDGTISEDTDIVVSRSTNNGATWSPASRINIDPPDSPRRPDDSPQIATDNNGMWIALWRNTGIHMSRSTNNGLTWSASVEINTPYASGTDPRLVTDHQGHWLAVWHGEVDMNSIDEDIIQSHSSNNGATWSMPSPVNTTASSDTWNDLWHDIGTDGHGNWIVVWVSGDFLGGSSTSDWDTFLSRSTNNGATWSPPAYLNTNAPNDGTCDDGFPHVAADGKGHWVAAWDSQTPIANSGEDWDILTCRWSILLCDPENVFVDFMANENGVGTEPDPFDNMPDALEVAASGAIINFAAGSSSSTFTGVAALGKGHRAMTLCKSSGSGPARIGAP